MFYSYTFSESFCKTWLDVIWGLSIIAYSVWCLAMFMTLKNVNYFWCIFWRLEMKIEGKSRFLLWKEEYFITFQSFSSVFTYVCNVRNLRGTLFTFAVLLERNRRKIHIAGANNNKTMLIHHPYVCLPWWMFGSVHDLSKSVHYFCCSSSKENWRKKNFIAKKKISVRVHNRWRHTMFINSCFPLRMFGNAHDLGKDSFLLPLCFKENWRKGEASLSRKNISFAAHNLCWQTTFIHVHLPVRMFGNVHDLGKCSLLLALFFKRDWRKD